jgi:lysophospholipase L1-like esterase
MMKSVPFIAAMAITFLSLGLFAAQARSNTPIRYAVVGDSYSIGEGASPNESWPALLARHVNEQGVDIELVANPV